ncbi:hypothetical protein LJC58_04465 [Lachnospiraceae bacterium OttesenSCG-928-D06]|nr:hypothetical protein [Lachnospiraceae bacterium OttesenSCG-928-D06]
MDDKMIDDLVKMLDTGIEKGVGHVNIDVTPGTDSTHLNEKSKEVQTFRSSDCSRNPMACSVPTLHEGLDKE